MAKDQSRFIRWSGYFTGFCLFVLTVIGGLLMLVVAGMENSAGTDPLDFESELFDTRKIDQHLESFLADQEYLASSGLFYPTVQSWDPAKDAGPSLNRRLPWEIYRPGGKEEMYTVVKMYKDGVVVDPPLALPKSINQKLKDWGDDWMKRHREIDYERLDFSWMSRLHDYTYWNIDQDSPRSDFYAKDPYQTMSETEPNDDTLKNWARLRLMKAAGEESPLQALRDVRQLAKLALTTDDSILIWSAYLILKLEGKAHHYMKKNHKNVMGWRVINEETLNRMKRSLHGFQTMLYFYVPSELLGRILEHPEKRVGYCLAVSQGFRNALQTRILLEEAFPNRHEDFNRVMNKASSVCRKNHWRTAWNNPEFIPRMYRGFGWIMGKLDTDSDSTLAIDLMRFFPGAKRYYGIMHATLFKPLSMSRYDKPKKRDPKTPNPPKQDEGKHP